jgi:phosphoglycerate dehydrogenase-like enzyme
MLHTVLLEDYFDYARELPCVDALGKRTRLTIVTTKARSEAETVERLRDADIVITIRDRVVYTDSLLSKMGHVKLLSVCGSRLTHVDLEAATRHGVLIAAPPPEDHQGAATKYTTVEQTWNLILGLTKQTIQNDATIRAGGWQTRPAGSLMGRTLGLVGMGTIGRMVAEVGVALHMKVIAWSPHLTPEHARASGAESVAFETIFRESDIVSLHAPLLRENTGMIGQKELRSMQPHALLINTARAALVEEAALREALETRKIAGAGLDVFWEEPLPPGHWLRSQERVLLQPHLGGMTDQGYESLIAPAVDNVMAFLDGHPTNLVNPEAYRRVVSD